MASPTILVTRATGEQGRALIRQLQQNGYNIHAFVTDAKSERALALNEYGVTLFEGNLQDKDAVRRAATGASGLFLNLMPSFTDSQAERKEAAAVLEVAKEVGLKHVVFSTSLTIGRLEEIKGWDAESLYGNALLSKQDNEEKVRSAGLEFWTILRPGYFTSNFLVPLGARMFPELGPQKTFVSSFTPDTVLPLIDPYDIAAFTIAAFENPAKFGGQTIELASEARTVEGIVASLSKVAGTTLKVVYRTDEETEELGKVNPIIKGQLLGRQLINFIDVDKVNTWGVPVGTFDQFLAREDERVKSTFSL